jgi:hypothetical protein
VLHIYPILQHSTRTVCISAGKGKGFTLISLHSYSYTTVLTSPKKLSTLQYLVFRNFGITFPFPECIFPCCLVFERHILSFFHIIYINVIYIYININYIYICSSPLGDILIPHPWQYICKEDGGENRTPKVVVEPGAIAIDLWARGRPWNVFFYTCIILKTLRKLSLLLYLLAGYDFLEILCRL